MKKPSGIRILIAVICVVVLVLCIYYFVTRKNTAPTSTINITSQISCID